MVPAAADQTRAWWRPGVCGHCPAWPLGVILLAGETSGKWNPGVQRLAMDRYPFPMHTALLNPHPRWTHLFEEVSFQDDKKSTFSPSLWDLQARGLFLTPTVTSPHRPPSSLRDWKGPRRHSHSAGSCPCSSSRLGHVTQPHSSSVCPLPQDVRIRAKCNRLRCLPLKRFSTAINPSQWALPAHLLCPFMPQTPYALSLNLRCPLCSPLVLTGVQSPSGSHSLT